MLQETLGQEETIQKCLSSISLFWTFHILDVPGRSGGSAIGFNDQTIQVHNVWGSDGILGADIITSDLGTPLRILNIYGPCHNRNSFWDKLLQSPIMQADQIIVGGDLNFSLGHWESQGPHATPDPLSYYFDKFLDKSNFFDLYMAKKVPTWCNRIIGEATLARRLDHFFITSKLFFWIDRAR